MKIYLFPLFFTISVLLSTQSWAAEHEQKKSMITVVDQSGQAQVYSLAENGTYGVVTDSAAQKILEELMEKAKNISCGMTAAPSQITVTAGPFTATWLREELCK